MKPITKLLAVTSIVLVFTTAKINAQNVRLNAYSGYIFSENVDSYYDASRYYKGNVKGGFQWGAGVEFMAKPNFGLEVSYLREDTKASLINIKYPTRYHDYNLDINYIMLTGNRYFRKQGSMVEGFGGLGAGVGIFNAKDPSDGQTSNLTKFSWQLRGGAIIWASEKVGIKLQASLQSAVQAIGGGLFVGTGGVGGGVSTFSSIYQFGLGGGLTFNLGGHTNSKKK